MIPQKVTGEALHVLTVLMSDVTLRYLTIRLFVSECTE